jgi:hypothetical protein
VAVLDPAGALAREPGARLRGGRVPRQVREAELARAPARLERVERRRRGGGDCPELRAIEPSGGGVEAAVQVERQAIHAISPRWASAL